jgi:hypothetical protein
METVGQMSGAYVHHHYFAAIKVVVYLVFFGVVAVVGVIARRARRRNIGQYGQVPGQTWPQPPGSPFAAWGGRQGPGHPHQGYGQPQQGYPQPYGAPQPSPPGYDHAPQSHAEDPQQRGYEQPPW